MRVQPLLFLLPLLASACGGGSSTDTVATATAPLPESYYSTELPEGAVGVMALRGLEGEQKVAVRGEVMDFVEGFAAFTLADLELMSCADMDEPDHCATPWDFCCEDPDQLARGVATVEFHAEGQPLRGSVKGFHGIDHLTDVVIVGDLNVDSAGNLLIVAQSVHVE